MVEAHTCLLDQGHTGFVKLEWRVCLTGKKKKSLKERSNLLQSPEFERSQGVSRRAGGGLIRGSLSVYTSNQNG